MSIQTPVQNSMGIVMLIYTGSTLGLHGVPTIREYPNFNSTEDALKLGDAMLNIGTSKRGIIDVLTQRSLSQRLDIRSKYQHIFGQNLIEDLESNLSGAIQTLLVGLLYKPDEFYAHEVHRAIIGPGTDEQTLNDVLFCCRRNVTLRQIRDAYSAIYQKNITEEILDDVSGHYARLLKNLLTRERRTGIDYEKVQAIVDELVVWSTPFRLDENLIIKTFSGSSHEEIKAISEAHNRKSSYLSTLFGSINSYTYGDFHNLLAQMLAYAEDPIQYYANRFKLGFNLLSQYQHYTVVRLFIQTSEVDLDTIKNAFSRIYGVNLTTFVESRAPDLFSQAACNILKGNVS